jgi:succinate-semialdehyde dehydrogenase / glutarate-semialdehyde dehydrogenase
MQSINPANGELIAEYPVMSEAELRDIVSRADDARRSWAGAGFAFRSKLLHAAAVLLRSKAQELGRLMALEMGKPITAGVAEAEKSAWGCEFYADNAEELLADEPVDSPASRSLVRYQPLGTLLAVMPWNFPFWQVFRAAAPALMAGNAVLLKHSSNVSGCALAIEKIFHESGVPREVFRTLLAGSDRIAGLIGNPLIAAVTLTGSEAAGRSVGMAAGKALKPSVLELGGSDPFIVLPDADVGRAAQQAAIARTQNSGQSCIAAKRFLVTEPIYDEFTRAFREVMAKLKVGDPLDPATEVGPQARRELRDELHGQVDDSLKAGAVLTLGGEKPDGPGAWYPPTVLEGVTPGMRAFDEEVFGPVAAVIRVKDAGEAVRLANRSSFGLGASIWTANPGNVEGVIDDLECGMVFVNDFVRSDPRLPFGGVKNSGYGRELSAQGIRAFTNQKTIWIR